MVAKFNIWALAGAMLVAIAEIAGYGADEAVATNTPPASGTNFESFRLISERNIFNQNRSPRSARRETERKPAPVVQSLSLVGTMSYAKGDFAFFDGSKPEFKKPVKAGEKIAGYEVKEVKPSCVKIANESQEFEMKVGQQLRKENDGDWQLAAVSSRAVVEATNSESASSGVTSSSGSASEEEALKRLMEKRAKEINQ